VLHGSNDLLDLLGCKRGERPPLWRYAKAPGPWRLYRWTHLRTVSSCRPMWAAQAVALNRPEAIRYKAWKRSRLRGCASLSEARRKSSSVCRHFAISTLIIGLLRAGSWSGRSLTAILPLRPATETPGLIRIGV
jgi:hypothetical protein